MKERIEELLFSFLLFFIPERIQPEFVFLILPEICSKLRIWIPIAGLGFLIGYWLAK